MSGAGAVNVPAGGESSRAVFGRILDRAPVTRGEIIAGTGLSKATVSRAVDYLRATGLVAEGEAGEAARRGRPARALELAAPCGQVAGVSLGHKTTRVMTCDLRGRIRQRENRPTPSLEGAELAGWLADRIASVAGRAAGPLRHVAVALPPGLSEEDLGEALRLHLDAPVTLDSDAGLALAGALAGHRVAEGAAALYSVSTRLGFAAFDGERRVGRSIGSGGEVGHLPIGERGLTLSHLLSSRGLAETAASRGVRLTGEEDTWPEQLARESRLLELLAAAVATAVTAPATMLGSRVVYFSGRLAPLVENVLSAARRRLPESLADSVQIVVTGSEDAGQVTIRGAVSIARDHARAALLESISETYEARAARGRPGPTM